MFVCVCVYIFLFMYLYTYIHIYILCISPVHVLNGYLALQCLGGRRQTTSLAFILHLLLGNETLPGEKKK